jgi:hypothetical protein
MIFFYFEPQVTKCLIIPLKIMVIRFFGLLKSKAKIQMLLFVEYFRRFMYNHSK